MYKHSTAGERGTPTDLDQSEQHRLLSAPQRRAVLRVLDYDPTTKRVDACYLPESLLALLVD